VECDINSTKPVATPHHLMVARWCVPATIDIYRRLPRAHGHIDFVDLASPNFQVRAAILRDKNAMQAPLGRAKSGVVEAIKLVEMNGDELFPGRALQVANKSGTNSHLVATATLLRRPERLADGWRVALERRGW
jgi:hypothetical protein